jgi:hypothetical protein
VRIVNQFPCSKSDSDGALVLFLTTDFHESAILPTISLDLTLGQITRPQCSLYGLHALRQANNLAVRSRGTLRSPE